jgi:colicin import membrane protein
MTALASWFREPGLLLSSVAHVALLTAGLVSFSQIAPLPEADEGIPVEFITENQFSQISQGETDATEIRDEPSLRVDREAETREVNPAGDDARNTPAPPTRPQDIQVAQDTPPEPEPAPEPAPAPEPEPEPEPEPVPEPEAVAEAEPEPEPAAEPVAEVAETPTPLPPSRSARADAQRQAAARDAARAEQARREEMQRQEQERQEAQRRERERQERERQQAQRQQSAPPEAEVSERFDPDGIAALLRSTDDASARGSTGQQVSQTASLGTETGRAARLAPSQRDALIGIIQAQLRRCWDAPLAAQSMPQPPVATLRIALNADGSLAARPQVVNSDSDRLFQAVADSASRATQRCAPLSIPAEFAPFYEDWKTMVVNFDPRDA